MARGSQLKRTGGAASNEDDQLPNKKAKIHDSNDKKASVKGNSSDKKAGKVFI